MCDVGGVLCSQTYANNAKCKYSSACDDTDDCIESI